MTKIPYNKPAITYAAQVRKLKDRGLIINDEDLALHKLQHYNYYRLGAYWLPFESDHQTHQFKTGTKFEDVLRLYNFDRLLRLTVLDAIERVEVSVRAQWAHKLGHLHGSHAHLDASISKNTRLWNQNKAALKKEVDRSDEVFIKHLKRTYNEELPPTWAACEVMSLGLLSKWYSNLKPPHTRRLIANVYALDESALESWLHHLTVLRNNSAHHSRLWNRDFSRVLPRHTQNKPAKLKGEFVSDTRIYNSFIILLHMMDVLLINNEWRLRLKKLLLEHKNCLPAMGFPADWQSRGIWKT